MKFTDDQIKALKAQLSPSNVKTRKQGNAQLSYVEAWHAIDEANRIFGFDGWTRETVDLRCVSERERKIGQGQYQRDGWGVTYIAKVRIRIGDIVREGSGAGHGIDADLGLAHESALKEAESDAMKRGLMTFGNPFGLALYDKTMANVGDENPPSQPAKQEAQKHADTIPPKHVNYDTLVKELKLCTMSADIGRAWRDNEFVTLREQMPPYWQAKLKDEATRIGNELKAKEAAAKSKDTVDTILETFPGSRVTDVKIHNVEGRELHPMEGM